MYFQIWRIWRFNTCKGKDMEQKENIYGKPCGRAFLKITAMLSMLCDHIGYVLVPWDVSPEYQGLYYILRIIGRIAFPLFCFMLVEGFSYTHNRKKYMARLAVFAVISEIPFDLAFEDSIVSWNSQNVMWTLLTGFIVMYGIEKYEDKVLAKMLVLVCGCMLAFFMHTDYSYMGVLIIAILYICRHDKKRGLLLMGILLAVQGSLEAFAVLSIPLMLLYNPGKNEVHIPKYFFYIFYPAHLVILYTIHCMV